MLGTNFALTYNISFTILYINSFFDFSLSHDDGVEAASTGTGYKAAKGVCYDES